MEAGHTRESRCRCLWVLSSRTATAKLEDNSNTVYVEQKRIERGRWSRAAAGFIQKMKKHVLWQSYTCPRAEGPNGLLLLRAYQFPLPRRRWAGMAGGAGGALVCAEVSRLGQRHSQQFSSAVAAKLPSAGAIDVAEKARALAETIAATPRRSCLLPTAARPTSSRPGQAHSCSRDYEHDKGPPAPTSPLALPVTQPVPWIGKLVTDWLKQTPTKRVPRLGPKAPQPPPTTLLPI
jgi:hypothetical protein